MEITLSNSGSALNIKGTTYDIGIGTHSQSVILYQIPDSSVRFKAFAGLDIGGTSQGCGSTVEFMVANEDPTTRDVEVSNAVANSGRVSHTMNAEGIFLEADITSADKLYLVVTDAGDNYDYDHADWINPAIYTPEGDSMLLTSLDWVSATSGWDEVKKNTSLDGNTLTINGQTFSNGYGVNSYSTIEFDLPAGYTTFKAFCGVDDEVMDKSSGVTVEFMIFTQEPAITSTVTIPVNLTDLGFEGECIIRDLWKKSDVDTFSLSEFNPEINTHGAGLYRISPLNRSNEIKCLLSSDDTDMQPGDSITLTISISKTGTDTNSIDGWVNIYQNNSYIGAVLVDNSGEISFTTLGLEKGEYTFKAIYQGNTYFNLSESNQLIYTVTTALKKNIIRPNIWVSNLSGKNYLFGLKAGDQVTVFNLLGQIIDNFIVETNPEVIKGEGLVLVKVRSDKANSSIKAIL